MPSPFFSSPCRGRFLKRPFFAASPGSFLKPAFQFFLTLSSLVRRSGPGVCFFFAGAASFGFKVAGFLLLLSVLLPIPAIRAQQKAIPVHPKITGIDHLIFYSSDLKSARGFYGTKLGLNAGGSGCRETSRTCFTSNWATRQHIELEGSDSCPRGGCLKEIVFETGDARKLRSYLSAQGVKVGPISKGRNLSIRFDSQDPESHRIGFVQFPFIAIDDLPIGVHVGPPFLHAGIIVKDRPTMEHFYKDILGFRPYWHGGRTDDRDDWVSLQAPDGSDWVEFMLNVPDNADKRTLGVANHLALGVRDIQAAKAQLVKNGVALTEEPKIGRGGKWQLNVYDPDGTRIEFMEFAPVQKPCCSEYTAPHPKP
jgi:catechol 2,3-dioxygenase-like lactoylglutathione lyase family enzyme